MLGKLAGIADRACEHGRNRIFCRTDNAGNLERNTVIIKITQTCIGITKVDIKTGFGIY